MKKISFSIPCYRSEKTITSVIEEISNVVDKKDFDYEIVIAVDGSPDNVLGVLKDLCKDNKKIKVVNLSKNYGQASARMASLRYTTGDYVVCLDDDGQCPMDKLFDLINPLEHGSDVSIAKYPRKKQSLFKNFGSMVNKWMIRLLLSVPKGFEMSNFFAMKRYVVDQIIQYNNPYPYMTGLIAQITDNFCLVEMEERKRANGTTGYTIKKLMILWMSGLTNFSVKPLRVSSFIGAVCAVIGFVFGAFTVLRKFFVPDISAGWSSLIAVLLFIGGLLMLMLGMIGEYIGRMFICINNAPQYVIKEAININEEKNDKKI